MYAKYIKRPLDFIFSFFALLALSPLILLLAIIGAVAMRGNPFFVQPRPGKEEKIFNLIKFRTMTKQRDKSGVLLSDERRLNAYGAFLRSTSLDELPELVNVLTGSLSIIGPRPLLTSYLPLYNELQRRRHEIRPGLTGYAQVNGRNKLPWEEKFEMDVHYVDNITFLFDLRIFCKTIKSVLWREGINSEGSVTKDAFTGTPEKETLHK